MCRDALPVLPPWKKQKKEKKREKKMKMKKKKNPLYSVVQDVGLGQQNEKTYRLKKERGRDDKRN